jgi:hypothetical protein
MQAKIDNPMTVSEKPIVSATNRARSIRMPFVPAGAVTGIGSLPLMSAASAIQAVAEFSSEIPFWAQLSQLSERESIIGQVWASSRITPLAQDNSLQFCYLEV